MLEVEIFIADSALERLGLQLRRLGSILLYPGHVLLGDLLPEPLLILQSPGAGSNWFTVLRCLV